MSAEIKFRVWDVKRKNMVYSWTERNTGDHSLAIWPCITLEGKLYGISGYSNVGAEELLHHEWRFMQFIGLKDKDEKEIYQSDIVKVHDFNSLQDSFHVVKWYGDTGYPAFDLDPPLEEECNSLASIFQSGNYEIEVVGNIFENPEFLKRCYV